MPSDKDIPISCGDCGVYTEGLDNMIKHILKFHDTYTPLEANEWAMRWMDEAYDQYDLEMAEHYKNQKIQADIDHARGRK